MCLEMLSVHEGLSSGVQQGIATNGAAHGRGGGFQELIPPPDHLGGASLEQQDLQACRAVSCRASGFLLTYSP